MAQRMCIGLAFCGLVLAAPLAAEASVLYEGFGYQSGVPLVGQNGGAGSWASPWIQQGGFASDTVRVPGLSYSSGGVLQTTPGAAMSGSEAADVSMFRLFGAGHGANGSSLWISFLAQVDAAASANAYALLAIPGGNPNASGIAVSIARAGPNDTFLSAALAPYPGGGGGGIVGTTPIAFGETALLVARIDYRSGNDLVSLWLNPRLDSPPGAADITLGTLELNAVPPASVLRMGQGSFRTSFVDEIRLGATFEEVTPLVPAPGALSGLFVGVIAMRRQRRRCAPTADRIGVEAGRIAAPCPVGE